MHVFNQLPASGQLSLFLQLHERSSLFGDEDKYYGYVVSWNLKYYLCSYNLIWWCLDWRFCGDGDGLGNAFLLTLNRFCQY